MSELRKEWTIFVSAVKARISHSRMNWQLFKNAMKERNHHV
jgi:hypothetical protein